MLLDKEISLILKNLGNEFIPFLAAMTAKNEDILPRHGDSHGIGFSTNRANDQGKILLDKL